MRNASSLLVERRKSLLMGFRGAIWRLGEQEFLLPGDRRAGICLCPEQEKPHGSCSSSIPNKGSLYPAAFCSHGTEVSGKRDLWGHKQTSGMLPVIPLPSKSAVGFKAPLNDLFPKKTPV